MKLKNQKTKLKINIKKQSRKKLKNEAGDKLKNGVLKTEKKEVKTR